jgi:hypothetical protein
MQIMIIRKEKNKQRNRDEIIFYQANHIIIEVKNNRLDFIRSMAVYVFVETTFLSMPLAIPFSVVNTSVSDSGAFFVSEIIEM